MTGTHPQNRCLGYARVSTYGQTLDAQLEQLRSAGCTKIYREAATGAGRNACRTRAQLRRGQEYDFAPDKLRSNNMTDKLYAASRQLDCAIRLVAAHEDELAIHTLLMATFVILNDLASVQIEDYE